MRTTKPGRGALILAGAGLLALTGAARGQVPEALPNPPQPPGVGAPGAATNEELLKQLQALQKQVKDLQSAKESADRAKENEQALKQQISGLQKDLEGVKKQMAAKAVEAPPPPAPAMPPPPPYDQDPNFYDLDPLPGENVPHAAAYGYGGGGAGPSMARNLYPFQTGGKSNDHFPMGAAYKWNFGGGYTSLATPDAEFTVNLQSSIAADSANYDRQAVNALIRGFNIPIQRTYIYGNVTKNWEYQLSEQLFVGSFNLLDAFVNVHYDDRIMFKFGKQLAPFLWEYYAFNPLWEPVIFNSPLFQFAGKRQVGATVWGKVFNYKAQYQLGIYNGPGGAYYDFDRNKDFAGTFTITPFKGDGINWLDSLGFGIGVQTGQQSYLLNTGNTPQQQFNQGPNGAGEPTTNPNYLTSSGVPFFAYNDDVRAAGNRTKVAPQFFWLGRFSVSAEYMIQSRKLADANTTGTSVQRGYYVNASYFLTGERYSGDGTGGYTMISPISPFRPTRGEWGWGAWQLAGQFSELNIGTGDISRGFASPAWATRLDQLMVGINWFPNKYTRVSFDWVYDGFNKAIPLAPGAGPVDNYNMFWSRVAIFF